MKYKQGPASHISQQGRQRLIKCKTITWAVLLLLLTAACQTQPSPPSTLPPTATVVPTLTLLSTSTPLPTHTPAPTWPILFRGAPCEVDDSECVVSQETPFAYYSITSNGLDVQNITVFPSGILPPEGSPRSYGEPQFSPDGSLLAYPASKGLYVVDAMSEGRYLFQPDDTSGTNPVGPVCWMPDGQSLKFVVRHQKDGQWHHTFYRIGLDAADPQVLFSIDDLPSFIWSGICSPDGKEMAFTINPSGGKGDGIYVMNLESGERRQILSHYTVDQIRAPMPAWLQATTESLRESEKIIFAGTPCSLRGPDCAPVPGDPLHYYTINPDGTGLENVLAIPPLLVPPASAPASAFDGPVQPSPDGRMLAYAEINGVYVIDAMTGAASRIPPENSTPFWWFNSYRRAPVCWIEDGTALELKERTSRFRITSPDAKTQEETRVVYLSNPPDTILTWACLPNGEELAFSLSPKGGEQQGLYIMSLRDGEWRQVLRDYEVVSVGVWPSAPLYTYAPIPGPVWQIFFKGAPCAELITGCSGAFPGAPEYNYSIYSDGTGFQEIAKLPSVTDIVLPNGAPGLSQKPHLSPDGLYLVYYSSDHPRGLYIVNNR